MALCAVMFCSAFTATTWAQDLQAPATGEATPTTGAATAGQTLPPPPAPTSHILTVDRDRLFTQSLYGRRILSELDQEKNRLAAEARKVDAALAAEEKQLTEERKTLDPEAFRILADAFDEKVQALRDERPKLEQSFTARFERLQQTFFEQIGPILGAVVRDRGGVMIVDRRAILLTTQNVDITDEAIARIDALIGDGKPAEAPPASETGAVQPDGLPVSEPDATLPPPVSDPLNDSSGPTGTN